MLHDALGEYRSFNVADLNRRAGFVGALHGHHPGRQQRDPALLQGPAGPGVHGDPTRGSDGEGDPQAPCPQRGLSGPDHGAHAGHSIAGVDHYPSPSRVRDHRADTRPTGDFGRRQLGGHASAPPNRASPPRQALQLLIDLHDLLDQGRFAVHPGIGGEQPWGVGQQD